MNHFSMMKRHRQAGFSMTEVLISVLVLAVGVIGAAGMQLTALRTSQQSAFQTTALQLASEMADEMRANDSQMKLTDKNNPFLDLDYQSTSEDGAAAPGKSCYVDKCDGAELAAFNISEWKKKIKSSLPAGRARICRDSSPWDASTKALSWDCTAGSGNSGSLVIKIGWQEKDPGGTLVKDAAGQFPPSVAITVLPYSK